MFSRMKLCWPNQPITENNNEKGIISVHNTNNINKKTYKGSENLLNYSFLWYVKCIPLPITISLVWFVSSCFTKKIIKERYGTRLRNIDH